MPISMCLHPFGNEVRYVNPVSLPYKVGKEALRNLGKDIGVRISDKEDGTKI